MWGLGVGGLRVVARGTGWAGLWGAILLLWAEKQPDTPGLFETAWVLAGTTAIFFLVRNIGRLVRETSASAVAESLGTEPRDLLRTAMELSADPQAGEFHTGAILQAEKAFPKNWKSRLASGPWWGTAARAALGGILFLFVAWRVDGPARRRTIWPFGSDGGGILSVHPGNAVFFRGENVSVTVRVAGEESLSPQLEVRGPGLEGEGRSFQFVSPGVHTYVFRSLQDAIQYRVLFRGRRSPRFQLTPFDPPKLLALRAEVEPPAYAGKKPERHEDSLALKVLAGSTVRWSLRLDPADTSLRVDGGGKDLEPTKTSEGWRWEDRADRNLERRLWARRSKETGEALVGELSVEAVPDAPPVVTLLGPAEDLQADSKDRFPVTAEFRDDIGLVESSLLVRVNGGPWRREPWVRFSKGVSGEVLEREFDLGRFSLSEGDQLEIQAAAQDGQTPAGEGRSEVRRVSIAAYSAAHEKIEGDLALFQKDLLNRLAEEMDLRVQVRVSTPNWNGLATGQRDLDRRLAESKDSLAEILDRMSVDPRTDRGNLLEHRGIQESLNELTQHILPLADRSLSNQDRPGAENAMTQAVAELQRMALLSEQALRAQNTRRLIRDQGDLSNMAENLARSLAQGPRLSESEARAFQETARAMEEALRRIRERLEKMPKDLSEDFVNRAAVETLRFDRVSGALSRMAQALAVNDGAEALAAAQEALEQIQEIERQLARAGAGALGPGMGGAGMETAGALREADDRLREIIGKQESLLDRTETSAAQVLERHGILQAKGLDQLRAAAPLWESRAGEWAEGLSAEGHENAVVQGLRRLEVLSFDLGRALGSGHLPAAMGRLGEIQAQAEKTRDLLMTDLGSSGVPSSGGGVPTSNPGEAIVSDVASLASESRSFLDLLGTPFSEGESLSLDERLRFPVWAEEQDLLGRETRGLAQALADLTGRNALLSPGLPRRLSDAAVRMEGSGSDLRLLALRSAQKNQEQALELLRDVQESLSKASRNMQSLSSGAGSPSIPTLRQGGGSGGTSGAVELPRPHDFRPPRAFREELMKSMKEGYPKDQERAIQDYYRHWAK